MVASFPSSVKSFTALVDNVDEIEAANINSAYDEIAAIETELLTNKTLIRDKLSSDLTYYVRTDGNDSNTGLANNSGGAFLTIQKAIDAAASLDCVTYNVTIQVADGTYVANTITCKNILGTGTVTIQGNSGTPTNVVIDGGYYKDTPGTIYVIKDQRLEKASGSATTGIRSFYGAYIKFSGLDFYTGYTVQLQASYNGVIEASGNYTISGAASYHAIADGAGVVKILSKTITISGTPAFTVFALASETGSMFIGGDTFTGSATGSRYSASTNAVIQTYGGGATYLPGDAGGTTATGGQYA